jgi:ABC-type sugar transport system permease subunit
VIGHRRRLVSAAMFLLPALALYGLFVLYPYVLATQRSFTAWSGFSGMAPFVGLQNFQALLDDKVFIQSVENNLVLMATLPIVFSISLLLSVVLYREYRFAKTMRVIVVMPLLLALPTVAALARQAYQPDWGFVNSILDVLGLQAWRRPWLAEPDIALYAVAAAWIWYATSFYFIIFSAGLRNIPHEIFEAAELDGARPWKQFTHITFPLLKPVLRVSVFFYVIGIFLFAFPLVHVMTQGGPSHATEVMGTWLYSQAFLQAKFGYASAIGVAVLVVSLVIAGLGALLLRSKE